jgi:3-methyladenine DNA glycosylase/8-oxoguanine DNA glycosylase
VGVSDPCWRVEPGGSWWWATRTPSGPLTTRLLPGEGEVGVEAWGDGVEWLAPRLPRLVGASDPDDLDDASDLVAALATRFPGFRMAGHGRVADAAVEAICRRGVSGFEAARSWSLMVEAMGDDAPGPGGLRLPPAPRRLASCDPYDLHVLGLEQGRADEVRRVGSHASRLEVDPRDGGAQALAHLAGIAGIGADVVTHARSVALGDADAAPVIDAHHTAAVVRTLWTGSADTGVDLPGLMEPHAPHRGRLVRLIALAAAADAAGDVGL